jgi:alpha-N-arabinofuranosidase
VVRIACIAQLVNVIAPIMTEPGGPAWKQTTYYPYYFASIFGRGTALNLSVDCPGYDADIADNVSYVDIAGVHDSASRTVTLFAVNRHATEEAELVVNLQGFGAARVIDHQVITHPDLKAVNDLKNQNTVVPRAGSGLKTDGGTLTGKLPAYSYQMIRLQVG